MSHTAFSIGAGHYTISIGAGAQGQTIDVLEQALGFEVHHTDVFGTGVLLPFCYSSFLVDSKWEFSGVRFENLYILY